MSGQKSASIDPLPGIPWSAEAALHSALATVPKGAKVLILWTDEKLSDVEYTCAGLKNCETVWLCEQMKRKALVA